MTLRTGPGRWLSGLLGEERGQDLIEYALLATFVALVAIGGVTALITALNNWFGVRSGWFG
jgi:Flp pilus assembly pilin Flp